MASSTRTSQCSVTGRPSEIFANRNTRSVLAVLLVVAGFYVTMVSVRVHQHDGTLWFVHLGSHFETLSHTSTIISPRLGAESADGYDGQFFYFIAVDPAHARDYMHETGEADQSGIRYARILYPLLARGLSGGDARVVPYSLVAINLLAICAGTAALALWLVQRRRSAWFAVIYGLWPGLVFSVFRDLAEPVAYGLVVLAALVFEPRSQRRVAGAAALLALSLLTRETTIIFPLIGGAALWLQDRTWRRAALFVVASVAPMFAWRVALTLWFHVTTLERAEGWKALVPFHGMAKWWPWNNVHWLMLLTLDVPLVLVGAVAVYLLWTRRAVLAAVSILLNLALFVVFVPSHVIVDFGAAGRNATPVTLAALFAVPALTRRTAAAVGIVLSPLWYLAAAAALGVAGLQLVTG